MNIVDFTRKFHRLEERCELFALIDDQGTYYWDVVRYYVFNYVYANITKTAYICYQPPIHGFIKRWAKRTVSLIMRSWAVAYVLTSRKDILFIKCSRARKGNRFYDPILDQLSDFSHSVALNIETCPFTTGSVKAAYLFDYSRPYSTSGLTEKISDIENAFRETFGVKVDLRGIILDSLRVYCCEFRFYNRLFRLGHIKHVFVVQNGIQKGLFRAAQINGVDVNELQHGYIGYTHAAYSYPKVNLECDQVYLPKRLLVYSDCWLNGLYFPISAKIEIGSKNHTFTHKPKQPERILVVSTALHHENLRDLLIRLVEVLPGVIFSYKLHPNQFSVVNSIRNQFSRFNNIDVISDERTLNACLETDMHVLCIQSTAVYEALQSGSFVYCYNRQNCNSHDNVADVAGFSYFDNENQFIQQYKNNRNLTMRNYPEYFKPFTIEQVKSIILGRETQAS